MILFYLYTGTDLVVDLMLPLVRFLNSPFHATVKVAGVNTTNTMGLKTDSPTGTTLEYKKYSIQSVFDRFEGGCIAAITVTEQ